MSPVKVTNPIIPLDYPDPDIIRVGDTFYMVSTTMYFFPGCEVLRSYDLVHWEHASYVFKTLDSTDNQRLFKGNNIYGQGMWAATIRHHKGVFYILFVANDTQKTYLYTSKNISGPCRKESVEGFYHDGSLLFDDDERVYIVYGNTDIYVTELKSDLSGPKTDGISRCIISEKGNPHLSYEGAHVYKLNGYYYVFLIHSLKDRWMRVQACFMSDTLDGEFKGEDILIDDLGLTGQGVAQGGIVDTPQGDWYSILFQDSGAVGRLPVLVPIKWVNDFPVIGHNKKIPTSFYVKTENETYRYSQLVSSDDFKTLHDTPFKLKPCWQFNHEPQEDAFLLNTQDGCFLLKNTSIKKQVTQAENTLTQRMRYPLSSAEVTLDGKALKDGDVSGLCALQGTYGFIALTKEKGKYYIVMRSKEYADSSMKTEDSDQKETEFERIEIDTPNVTIKLTADFRDGKDSCQFYYKCDDMFIKVGVEHQLTFNLDFFTGCRYGLFSYATQESGGSVKFSEFIYLK